MEFNVAQLLREPIGSSREYEVEEEYEPERGAPRRITGHVSLLRTDRSILACAVLDTTIDVECSRCLKPVCMPVQLALEDEFFPTVDVNTGAPLPSPEEPSAFRIDKHHVLDLDEAIRQDLLMAEPMQPLCRPNCAGLCPECGADLNRGECGCAGEEIDSRWSALRRLANDSG